MNLDNFRVYRVKNLTAENRLCRWHSWLAPLLLLIFFTACRAPAPNLLSFSGLTMGTTYSVKLVPQPGTVAESDLGAIQSRIDQLLVRVNQRMSVYQDDSEISRFNRSTSLDWMAVSAETAGVVAAAQTVSRLSSGALDVTVSPLINAWGFGPVRTEGYPSQQQIRHLLGRVGYRHLEVRRTPPALKKDIPDLSCDLAAIAKGYGVDRVAEYLNDLGVRNYLVEIGGEIRARGRNHRGECWRVGVAAPGNDGSVQRVIPLCDRSMATSGDYRNFFIKNGVRYSHTINPESGYPVSHNLASVTVISSRCMIADALATALNVLGEEEGYQLALRESVAAYFIIRSGDEFVEQMTPALIKMVKTHD